MAAQAALGRSRQHLLEQRLARRGRQAYGEGPRHAGRGLLLAATSPLAPRRCSWHGPVCKARGSASTHALTRERSRTLARLCTPLLNPALVRLHGLHPQARQPGPRRGRQLAARSSSWSARSSSFSSHKDRAAAHAGRGLGSEAHPRSGWQRAWPAAASRPAGVGRTQRRQAIHAELHAPGCRPRAAGAALASQPHVTKARAGARSWKQPFPPAPLKPAPPPRCRPAAALGACPAGATRPCWLRAARRRGCRQPL